MDRSEKAKSERVDNDGVKVRRKARCGVGGIGVVRWSEKGVKGGVDDF